jgi:hypothetical protein
VSKRAFEQARQNGNEIKTHLAKIGERKQS